jgi:rhodanese-related sulfurtransferase
MTLSRSLVLEHPAVAPAAAREHFQSKLAFEADIADLHADLENGVPGLVVVDARSADAYARGHVPGALNLPHRLMDAKTTAALPREALIVVYCDGVGCNGSTKGALKLAGLGFHVKEMPGGLDWWRRDGHPVAVGSEPGSLVATAARCGC